MEEILYSPQVRALSAIISTFGSGVLCSAVVTDITVDGKLVWKKLGSSGEFWVTVVFAFILLAYYIGMYRNDVKIRAVLADYQDKDLLVAMARQHQMKDLMKWAKQQARRGNLDQLHSLDKFLKGEYGNESYRDDRQGTGKGKKASQESSL
jgi:hypothetical protein